MRLSGPILAALLLLPVRLASSTDASADREFERGMTLGRLGRLDEAQAVFELGRQAWPGDKRFLLELAGVAYKKKDTQTAIARLRAALRLDPADSYANDFLGTLYLLSGNLPAALKYWNRVGKPLVQASEFSPLPDLDPVLRERLLAISGGQVFTVGRLEVTESNLDRLGLFARRETFLKPRPDQRYDVEYRWLPPGSPAGGWLGRVLPLVRSVPYQAIEFDRYNLGGRAIQFTSLWRWDPDKRRIDVAVTAPFRLNPRLLYRLEVDARDESWDLRRSGLNELQLQRISAAGGFTYGLTGRLEWSPGFRIVRRRVQHDNGDPLFADSWSFEQRNGFDYRLKQWPEHRAGLNAAALLRTGRVYGAGGGAFARLEGELAGEWHPPAHDKLGFAVRLRGGRSVGTIPFDELFQLGMERDNDLWLRGHVGTRDGRKGNAPLGRDYALVQTEMDRTLLRFAFFHLRAGPFFDAGSIRGPAPPFGSRGWMPDAGVQAKIGTIGALTWSVIYGRDLRDGRGVFYTAVATSPPRSRR